MLVSLLKIRFETVGRVYYHKFVIVCHSLFINCRVVGYDISNFELDFLLNRVASNKVPHWHKISRLKRSGDIPRRSVRQILCMYSRLIFINLLNVFYKLFILAAFTDGQVHSDRSQRYVRPHYL